jgi:uncharacterized protein
VNLDITAKHRLKDFHTRRHCDAPGCPRASNRGRAIAAATTGAVPSCVSLGEARLVRYSTSVMSPPFTLLIKPAGADCNLNCGYCFYLKKAELYPPSDDRPGPPRMDLETVEATLSAYFQTPQPVYSFAWQGGEPTLMGVDFFRDVFAMQRRMAPRGAEISNGLQTNGTLLTESWARLFREYNVLVGLSIDGPEALHNARRRWADREGYAIPGTTGDTHARVEAAARLLREERVQYNALTVVGRHNEAYPVEIYEYLRSLKIRHMQFIPLIEWEATRAGAANKTPVPSAVSVTPEGWGNFLNAIFDRWFPRDVRRVSIRHHDSIMELLIRGQYNVCTMSGACGGHFVVEHTGDIYPCDFFVEPELLLGNVHRRQNARAADGAAAADRSGVADEVRLAARAGAAEPVSDDNPFRAALGDPRHRAFVRRKARWAPECETCRYRWLCGGDCPKMRPPVSLGAAAPPVRGSGNIRGGGDVPGPHDGISALCAEWVAFYDHTLADFERLSRAVAPEVTGQPPVLSRDLAQDRLPEVPGGS